jgi:hypothetical protein
MSYAFIELGKFNKSWQEVSTLEDHWLFLFKKAHEVEELPPNAPEEIEKAYETLEQYKWSEDEKEA